MGKRKAIGKFVKSQVNGARLTERTQMNEMNEPAEWLSVKYAEY